MGLSSFTDGGCILKIKLLSINKTTFTVTRLLLYLNLGVIETYHCYIFCYTGNLFCIYIFHTEFICFVNKIHISLLSLYKKLDYN